MLNGLTSGRLLAVSACAGLLALAGCGSDKKSDSSSTASTTPAATADSGVSLKGICPDTINVQTDWNPEAEHSELYELAGPGGVADNGKKTYTAPLYTQGKDTGVKIQIRSGGPAIGFQLVSAQMYSDPSILLGYVNSDEQIQYSAKQPTVALVAPRENTPFMLMYDPSKYDFKTMADVGKSGAKVLYFQGATFIDYLVGKGDLTKDQIDSSYDGKPARFVAAGGKDVQQGFITAEPYQYEHEIKAWGKPLKVLRVYDTGYKPYAEPLVTKPENVTKYAACFKKLIPMIQQAQVDYAADPTAANKIIVKIVPGYKTGWVYPQGLADYSVKAQLDNDIIGNGPDSTLGNFDDARIDTLIGQVKPIFAKRGKAIKDGLTAKDIETNQFIDTKIGLPK